MNEAVLENVNSASVRSKTGGRILALSKAATKSQYSIRLAQTREDVRAAQNLRFNVFNLELKEGLESSYYTLLDEDQFDPVCDHLLVEDSKTSTIVGVYRLQTGIRAAANFGYYSEQEFDFKPFEPLRSRMVELGRACVHSHHRNLYVLGMLWHGIAEYARRNGAVYLIGCSSLTSQNPAEGMALYHKLAEKHLVAPELRTRPISRMDCSGYEVQLNSCAPKVPKLLSAYLSIGARICGIPALDAEFKTIDFLTLLDLRDVFPDDPGFF